jgi:hypothetical protein
MKRGLWDRPESHEYGVMIHGFITMGDLVDAAAESMEAYTAALAMTFGAHEQGGG